MANILDMLKDFLSGSNQAKTTNTKPYDRDKRTYTQSTKASNDVARKQPQIQKQKEEQKLYADTDFSKGLTGHSKAKADYNANLYTQKGNKFNPNDFKQEDIYNLDGTRKDYTEDIAKLEKDARIYGRVVGTKDGAKVYDEAKLNETNKLLDKLTKHQEYIDYLNGVDYINNPETTLEDANKFLELQSHTDDRLDERLANIVGKTATGIANIAPQAYDLAKEFASEYSADLIESEKQQFLDYGWTEEQFNDYVKSRRDLANPLDEDNWSQKLKGIQDEYNQFIYQGTDGIEQFGLQAIDSTANFGAHYMMAMATGGSSLVSMGLQSGAEKAMQNLRDGYDIETATLNGALTGALTMLTEKLPTDNFSKMITSPLGQFAISGLVTQMASEGLEEGIEYLVEPQIDKLTLGKNVEYSRGELFTAVALGMASGGALGGAGLTINNIRTAREANLMEADLKTMIQYRDSGQLSPEETNVVNNTIQTYLNALNSFKNNSVLGNAVKFEKDQVKTISAREVQMKMNQMLQPAVDMENAQVQQTREAYEDLQKRAQNLLSSRDINMKADQYFNLDENTRKEVDKMQNYGTELGVKLSFDEELDGDGVFDNKTKQIVINPRSQKAMVSTFVHELTHGNESSKYYKPLRDFAKQYVDKHFEGGWEAYNKYLGEGSYQGLELEGLEQETTAIAMQENLGNEEFIEELIDYNNSLATRIFEEVKRLASGGDKYSQDIEYNFKKAFADKAKTQKEGKQYALINIPNIANNIVYDSITNEELTSSEVYELHRIIKEFSYYNKGKISKGIKLIPFGYKDMNYLINVTKGGVNYQYEILGKINDYDSQILGGLYERNNNNSRSRIERPRSELRKFGSLSNDSENEKATRKNDRVFDYDKGQTSADRRSVVEGEGDYERISRLKKSYGKSIKDLSYIENQNRLSAYPQEIQDEINNSMTMEEAHKMMEDAYNLVKDWYEYKDVDEFIEAEGDDAVDSLVEQLENHYNFQTKYINPHEGILNEDYTIGDVIDAFRDGTLKRGKTTNEFRKIDLTNDVEIKNETFYTPKVIEDYQNAYEIANQKINNNNREEVSKARANVIIFSHNKNASNLLGITESELNKKVRQWSRYSSSAKKLSQQLNDNVANAYKWSGLENSNLLSRYNVTDEELRSVVREVNGEESDYQRRYIINTMLAIDSHIDYSRLGYTFANEMLNGGSSVRGLYSSKDIEIKVRNNYQHTISHETGHYIDNLWGRELTKVLYGEERNVYLSDLVYERKTFDNKELQSFYDNFKDFMKDLSSVADNRNEYVQNNTETFARFVDKFVRWVNKNSGGYEYEDYGDYADKFTTSQFHKFVKLLQQKNYLQVNVLDKTTQTIQNEDVVENNTTQYSLGEYISYESNPNEKSKEWWQNAKLTTKKIALQNNLKPISLFNNHDFAYFNTKMTENGFERLSHSEIKNKIRQFGDIKTYYYDHSLNNKRVPVYDINKAIDGYVKENAQDTNEISLDFDTKDVLNLKNKKQKLSTTQKIDNIQERMIQNVEEWIPNYDILSAKYSEYDKETFDRALFEILSYGKMKDTTKEQLIGKIINEYFGGSKTAFKEYGGYDRFKNMVEDAVEYFGTDSAYRTNKRYSNSVASKVNEIIKGFSGLKEGKYEAIYQSVEKIKETEKLAKQERDREIANTEDFYKKLATVGKDEKISNWKTLEQNLDLLAGGNVGFRNELREHFEVPKFLAQTNYITTLNKYNTVLNEIVNDLGIVEGSEESKAVQWLLEKKKESGEEYSVNKAKDDFNYKMPNGKLAYENIMEASSKLRKAYDEFYTEIEEVRDAIYGDIEERNMMATQELLGKVREAKRNLDMIKKQLSQKPTKELQAGYNKALQDYNKLDQQYRTKILEDASFDSTRRQKMPYRENYAHHVVKRKNIASQLFEDIFGDVSRVPTKLAGISDFAKPKSGFAGFMMKRKGGSYEADAVAGFAEYLKQASKIVAYDPLINTLRNSVTDLRSVALENETSRFTEYMTDYINDLANKTNPIDRGLGKVANNGVVKAIKTLNERAKTNAILYNARSAIVQFANLPNGIAELTRGTNIKDATQDIINGVNTTIQNLSTNDSAEALSPFLNSRFFDINTGKRGAKATAENVAKAMLETGDKIATRIIWNSAYQQALRTTQAEPIMYADDITRRAVAGRGIGERPLAITSKYMGLIMPFSTETNNAWQNLKSLVKEKEWTSLIALLVSSWLMNWVYDELLGDRPLFDPIDAIVDGIKIALEEHETTGKYDLKGVTTRLAGEVIGATPLGAQVPSLLGLDEQTSEKIFGDQDPSRYGTGNIGLKGVGDVLTNIYDENYYDAMSNFMANYGMPAGGKQTQRTVEALQSYGVLPQYVNGEWVTDSAHYTASGNVGFVNDTPLNDPLDFMKTALFGKWAGKNAQEYLEGDNKGYLRENDSALYKAFTNEISSKEAYDVIQKMNEVESLKDENGNTITNSKSLGVRKVLEDAGLFDEYLETIEEGKGDVGKTVRNMSLAEFEAAYKKAFGKSAQVSVETKDAKIENEDSEVSNELTKPSVSSTSSDSFKDKYINAFGTKNEPKNKEKGTSTTYSKNTTDKIAKAIAQSSGTPKEAYKKLNDILDEYVNGKSTEEVKKNIQKIRKKYIDAGLKDLIDKYLKDNPYADKSMFGL